MTGYIAGGLGVASAGMMIYLLEGVGAKALHAFIIVIKAKATYLHLGNGALLHHSAKWHCAQNFLRSVFVRNGLVHRVLCNMALCGKKLSSTP